MRRVGVDIGGTFTDLVWLDDSSGQLGNVKTLSTGNPVDGLVRALELSGVRPSDTSLLVHATTLVTNLILEGRGARVGLLTTLGFRDALEIQTGLRPNPYDLQWERTPALVPRWLRAEIAERIDAEGNILVAPSREEVEAAIGALTALGIEALAICLLHSYINPTHEELVSRIARERWPHLLVSASIEVDPRIREYPRMSTTVANAFAMPRFERYARDLASREEVPKNIRFMQSSGGVTSVAIAAKTPVNLMYSGPVGGVLGVKALGERIPAARNSITIDIGGTSCDMAVIRDGEVEEKDELFVKWGIPVRTHTADIHAIGAGGGSIATKDPGGALKVGPISAGSDPGPVCYGRGGTLPTVTDANCVLGLVGNGISDRLNAEFSPNRTLAERSLSPLAAEFGVTSRDLAEQVFRTVNANMAQAVREITVFKGIDPRDRTLVSYGGCGPQHAVEVAREIGIRMVLVPRFPSVFSALGLLSADLMTSAVGSVLTTLDNFDPSEFEARVHRLVDTVLGHLVEESITEGVTIMKTAYARYVGQSHELSVPLSDPVTAPSLRARFEQVYGRRYGATLGDPVEVVDVRVTGIGHVGEIPMRKWAGGSRGVSPASKCATAWGESPIYRRDSLAAGEHITGPALIAEAGTTTYLPSDAEAHIDAYGNVRIAVT